MDDVARQGFIERNSAPRLEGFTLLPAQGQWRDPASVIHGEASRVLEVAADEAAALRQSSADTIGTYKTLLRRAVRR